MCCVFIIILALSGVSANIFGDLFHWLFGYGDIDSQVQGNLVRTQIYDNLDIEITPHTIPSFQGCQNVTITNLANVNRVLDVALSFDPRQSLKLKSTYLFNPITKYNTQSYTCSGINGLIDNDTAWCNTTQINEYPNQSIEIIGGYHEIDFDRREGKTVYVDNAYTDYWSDLSDKIKQTNISGKQIYYFDNVNFKPRETKTTKICLQEKPDSKLNSKYDVFVKDNFVSLDKAITNKEYVLVDPWVNSSCFYRSGINVINPVITDPNLQFKLNITTPTNMDDHLYVYNNVTGLYLPWINITGINNSNTVTIWTNTSVTAGTNFGIELYYGCSGSGTPHYTYNQTMLEAWDFNDQAGINALGNVSSSGTWTLNTTFVYEGAGSVTTTGGEAFKTQGLNGAYQNVSLIFTGQLFADVAAQIRPRVYLDTTILAEVCLNGAVDATFYSYDGAGAVADCDTASSIAMPVSQGTWTQLEFQINHTSIGVFDDKGQALARDYSPSTVNRFQIYDAYSNPEASWDITYLFRNYGRDNPSYSLGSEEINNVPPVINSYSVSPTPTHLTDNILIVANVTDGDGNNEINAVNFTLIAPNGTIVINNVNGTLQGVDNWSSESYIIMDVGIWTYTINATSIDGSDTVLDTFSVTELEYPIITSLDPVNNSNFTTNSVNFLIDSTDNYQLQNTSILGNFTGTFSTNITNLTSGTLNSSSLTITNLDDGYWLWAARVCDTSNNCNQSENYTLLVDTSPPSITTETYSEFNISSTNVIVNATVTELLSGLDTIILSENSTGVKLNHTITTHLGDVYYHELSITNLSRGECIEYQYYANDTLGNLGNGTLIVACSLNTPPTIPTQNNPANNSIVGELADLNCSGSIDADGDTVYYEFYGDTGNPPTTLLWNSTSTNYTWTLSVDDIYYWDCRANDTFNVSGYSPIRQIAKINNSVSVAESCTTGLIPAMYFDFVNETDRNYLNATVDYNLEFSLGDNGSSIVYGTISNVGNFSICLNTTTSSTYNVEYGEFEYSRTGYTSRRYYLFEGDRFTTTQQNDSLVLLDNGDATSFLFTFKSTSLSPYENKYASILRWYPELNYYDNVEMGKTDNKGQTVMRVKVEDVDYRVALYYTNGTLIKLLDPVRFTCLASPCSYSSLIDETTADYTSIYGIESSLTFINDGVFYLTYNDPSQLTSKMNMSVYKETGTSSTLICSTGTTGFTGVLSCNVSEYSGTLKATVYRSASPAQVLIELLIDSRSTIFKSQLGLFFNFLCFIGITFMGLASPILVLVFGLIGLIPALVTGSINLTIFIGLGIMAGLIVHFIKRVS